MLAVGFARLDITPPLGIFMQGYYSERRASGIRDPLYVNAVAFSDGEQRSVVLVLDIIGMKQDECDACRDMVAERNDLPREAVFVACTHTHTGPVVSDGLYKKDPLYNEMLFRRLADAATLALADLKPASCGIARNTLKDIAFIRRFRMQDGTTRTNPGRRNPNIAAPCSLPDESVQLVRITRENAPEILLVNFQVHPDVIGGTLFSADFPGFVRSSLERVLDNVHCVYFNGAQGDTNHINVHAPAWDSNNGYEHARHMGRSIAGAVLQIYGKTAAVTGDKVAFAQRTITVPTSRVEPELVRKAEAIIALHEAGRDAEIPETGMGVTTLVAEAYTRKRLEHGPDELPLHFCAVAFADIAITGAPGEPFNEIGRSVKAASPFAMTLYCCCANGSEAYFPMRDAYAEGGYEARSSKYAAGVAEAIIENGSALLRKLRK
jgi:neutral ceramidase